MLMNEIACTQRGNQENLIRTVGAKKIGINKGHRLF